MGLNNSKVEGFINEVCSYVKFKKAHREIKAELSDHLQESIEELKDSGFDEEEASKKALLQMGNAELIGKQLNESHRAVPEWSILAIAVVLSIIGIITAYLLMANHVNNYIGNIFFKSLISNIVGYASIVGLYFFDYRKLQKYSKQIFIGMTLILVFQALTGMAVNGKRGWLQTPFFPIDITELSLFIYAAALPGMLRQLKWVGIKNILYGFGILLLPMMLYVSLNTLFPTAVYFSIFIIYMISTKVRPVYIFSSISMFCLTAITFLTSEQYRIARLLTFLNPRNNANGDGYVYIQISKLLNSTGLMGNGFTFPHNVVPEVHKDFVFTYIVYTFGWVAGIVVMVLAFAFIMRMLWASRKVKDSYGSLIIKGLMCIFTLKFMLNIMMILGAAPILGVNLPFISSGGSNALIQMAEVGLIMSIYRRKSLSNISMDSAKA